MGAGDTWKYRAADEEVPAVVRQIARFEPLDVEVTRLNEQNGVGAPFAICGAPRAQSGCTRAGEQCIPPFHDEVVRQSTVSLCRAVAWASVPSGTIFAVLGIGRTVPRLIEAVRGGRHRKQVLGYQDSPTMHSLSVGAVDVSWRQMAVFVMVHEHTET